MMLAERLLKRFKGVPNVTLEDAYAWVEEAATAHGYSADKVPPDKQELVLLYAQAVGVEQVALSVADYYMYKDEEETIDKSRVSDQYRTIAHSLWRRYKEMSASLGSGLASGSSSFSIMKRVDRP